MEERNVAKNEEKYIEYQAIRSVIKDTIKDGNYSSACLTNNTLNTLAGYTDKSTKENYNPFVRDFIDKLMYDEHNSKVKAAKEKNDTEELARLSNRVMSMAGYGVHDPKKINKYAKSFVDRKFFNKPLSRYQKAVAISDEDAIKESYKKIYAMTSYSDQQPFGVVNEYAQSFVDTRLDEYIKLGIHTPVIKPGEKECYAI